MSATRKRAAAKKSAPADLLPPYLYVLDPDNPSGLLLCVAGELPEGVEDCERRPPPDDVFTFIDELEKNVSVEKPRLYATVSGNAFPSSDGPRNLRPAASCAIRTRTDEAAGSEMLESASEHETWEGTTEATEEPVEDDGPSEAGANAEEDPSDQSGDDVEDRVESFREELGYWFAAHPSANVSIADVSDTEAAEIYFGSRSKRQRRSELE
ncbi:hypothetical protein FQN53_004871 [Emmonsiellopsis sp. PD_33]|nr:hypothetical protein FQN53_004871 [Emmonsiellopsis sp. PD_33]